MPTYSSYSTSKNWHLEDVAPRSVSTWKWRIIHWGKWTLPESVLFRIKSRCSFWNKKQNKFDLAHSACTFWRKSRNVQGCTLLCNWSLLQKKTYRETSSHMRFGVQRFSKGVRQSSSAVSDRKPGGCWWTSVRYLLPVVSRLARAKVVSLPNQQRGLRITEGHYDSQWGFWDCWPALLHRSGRLTSSAIWGTERRVQHPKATFRKLHKVLIYGS